MTLQEILINAGFETIDETKLTKNIKGLGNVDAYLNGDGVIFHFVKAGKKTGTMSIQVSDADDVAAAFSQILSVVHF